MTNFTFNCGKRHKIYHCYHFKVYSLVVLTVFTLQNRFSRTFSFFKTETLYPFNINSFPIP